MSCVSVLSGSTSSRTVRSRMSPVTWRRSRTPSRRGLADLELLVEIEAARSGYRRAYGARKTWKELRRRDVEAGRDQVARVMRQHGIEGKLRGRRKRTTIPDEAAIERARDLLQRDFKASRPNEKWVADLTYVRTWNGFLYLAFILDCYSRMIVGWQLATHNARRARARRARDGQRPAPTQPRPDRTQRPRLAIHQPDLHRPARRAQDRPLCWLKRRRLR